MAMNAECHLLLDALTEFDALRSISILLNLVRKGIVIFKNKMTTNLFNRIDELHRNKNNSEKRRRNTVLYGEDNEQKEGRYFVTQYV